MSLPKCDTLKLELTGGALHVTLDRPEVKNAMSLAMVSELEQALEAAEATARVLVLRGAGGNFCAGGDIKDMAAARARAASGDKDAMAETSSAFGDMCTRFSASPLPIICITEGVVMGGGFGLSCVADVVIAAPDVTFALPETGLGLIPAQIMPFLLQRLGLNQTRRLAVTGGKIRAEEALSIGLVHEVPVDIDTRLAEITAQIRRCAPGATAVTKQLVDDLYHARINDVVPHAARLFADAAAGSEGMEGTAAFVAKRPPDWALED